MHSNPGDEDSPSQISHPWGEQERALIKHRLRTSNDAMCFLMGPHLVFRAPPPPRSPRPPAASTGSERAGTCSTPQCHQAATCASKRQPAFLAHALGSPLFWLWPTSHALVYVLCHRLQDPSLPICPDLSRVAPTDPDLQVSGQLVGQGGGTGHGLVVSKANSMDLSEQEKTDTHNKSNSLLDEELIPGPRGSNMGRRNRGAWV